MLTETMKEHHLLTGVWWAPQPSATHEKRTRAVWNLMERQYRGVSYEMAGSIPTAKGGVPVSREFHGLIERHSSVWESLALYIRLLYGDGIFYSQTDGGMVWLLIINEGVIVPGTDCLMSPGVFDALMEGRKFSQYKALPVRELSEDSADDILNHYRNSQLRLKKRRYVLYGVLVCLALVLLSIPLAFILIG